LLSSATEMHLWSFALSSVTLKMLSLGSRGHSVSTSSGKRQIHLDFILPAFLGS
jgi:hypothetical protein